MIVDTVKQVDNTQVSEEPFQDDKPILAEVQIWDVNDSPSPLHDLSGEVVEVEALLDDEGCPEDEDIAFDSSTTPKDDNTVKTSDDD